MYGGTYNLLSVTLPRFGITTTFVDASNPDSFAEATQENTRAFFVESLGNPKLDVLDLEAIAEQSKAAGVPFIVDNTVASPALLNPIKLVNFFNAAIDTVTTDNDFNKNDLLTLGKQLKNLSADRVRTLTVPLSTANGRAAGVGSVVIWDSVLAPDLFNRLLNDQPIIDEVKATPSASASPTTTIVDKFKTQTASDNACLSAK